MTTFEQMNLDSNLIDALKKQNITSPTEVQSLIFNEIKDNKDLIVKSQTGSGKTLSYLLPLFTKIDTTKRETQVVVLAPTHELVIQICDQVKILSQNSGISVTTLPLIGEVNIQKQIKNIKSIKPHIVVGSCGRINDIIKQKKLKMHNVKTIVLDEVDSLFSKNNTSTIKEIIKTTLRDRQILGFSASLNEKTIDICSNLMKDVKIIKSGDDIQINPNILHMFLLGDKRDKFTLLRKSLAAATPKKSIIFVNDEDSIEIITNKLNYHGYSAVGIFGNMAKEDRAFALNKFRLGKSKILVSSDLSARGLDVVDTSHVFNLDFPMSQDEYIHRSGRTARGNRNGSTISIITKKELPIIKDYNRNFNIKIKPVTLKEGKLIDYK